MVRPAFSTNTRQAGLAQDNHAVLRLKLQDDGSKSMVLCRPVVVAAEDILPSLQLAVLPRPV